MKTAIEEVFLPSKIISMWVEQATSKCCEASSINSFKKRLKQDVELKARLTHLQGNAKYIRHVGKCKRL